MKQYQTTVMPAHSEQSQDERESLGAITRQAKGKR